MNRYAIIENSLVINIAIADPEFAISQGWIACNDDVTIGWNYINNLFTPPAPVYLTFDELNNDTQQRLDNFATTKGYKDIVSVCTYATSTNPQYKSDADYCVLARDATWEQLYLIFAEINQGTRPMPTDYDQIAVDLPVLAWPVI